MKSIKILFVLVLALVLPLFTRDKPTPEHEKICYSNQYLYHKDDYNTKDACLYDPLNCWDDRLKKCYGTLK